MKEYIPHISLFLFLGLLTTVGLADDTNVKVPLEQTGHAVQNVNLSGGIYSVVSDSAAITTVPTLLYGVVLTECAATAGYDIFDASVTANNSEATRVLPTTECESTTLPTYRTFDPPLRLNTGLAVDIIGLAAGGTGSTATFVTTPLYQ